VIVEVQDYPQKAVQAKTLAAAAADRRSPPSRQRAAGGAASGSGGHYIHVALVEGVVTSSMAMEIAH